MSTPLARGAALGALGGVGWGVLARVWMRLISTEPEFSWSGTLMILGLATLLGVGVGLVAASRRQGRSLWWTLAAVPGLLIFLSPGMLLAPCFLVGGLAFAGRGRLAHALGWAGIAVPVVGSGVLAVLVTDPGAEPATAAEVAVFVSGLAVLALSMAWAGSHLWRRRALRTAVVEKVRVGRGGRLRPTARVGAHLGP